MERINDLQPIQTSYSGHVVRGETVAFIHRTSREQESSQERENILNTSFTEFEMAVSEGSFLTLIRCAPWIQSNSKKCTGRYNSKTLAAVRGVQLVRPLLSIGQTGKGTTHPPIKFWLQDCWNY
jgi:hypothetical protein